MLDPTQKIEHIRKYWGETLLKDALEHAEEKVFKCSHYRLMLTLTILSISSNI